MCGQAEPIGRLGPTQTGFFADFFDLFAKQPFINDVVLQYA